MTAEVSLTAGELLAYVTRGGEADEWLTARAEDCVRALTAAAAPRYVTLFGALTPVEDGLALSGSTLVMRGRDIAAHLSQCGEAAIFCVTLGGALDRGVDALKLTDLSRGYLLDVAGSLLVEKAADFAEERIAAEAKRAGKGITARFSCGYGDFPIEAQEDFLTALGAQKRLGVAVTAGYQMIPRKSVTAVVGMGPAGLKRSGRCEVCPYRDTCKEKLCRDKT